MPKLPGIPGIERFKGHSFHTSRWDYDYTGGDPSGAPLTKLADKRVAIIGTGATAVQCVPHLARACKALYVFQRTPSSVDVRGNVPIDPDWFAGDRHARLAAALAGELHRQPGRRHRPTRTWCRTAGPTSRAASARKIMELPRRAAHARRSMLAAFEDSDFEKMEEIRARVRRHRRRPRDRREA